MAKRDVGVWTNKRTEVNSVAEFWGRAALLAPQTLRFCAFFFCYVATDRIEALVSRMELFIAMVRQ